jgi:hypothetical protein
VGLLPRFCRSSSILHVGYPKQARNAAGHRSHCWLPTTRFRRGVSRSLTELSMSGTCRYAVSTPASVWRRSRRCCARSQSGRARRWPQPWAGGARRTCTEPSVRSEAARCGICGRDRRFERLRADSRGARVSPLDRALLAERTAAIRRHLTRVAALERHSVWASGTQHLNQQCLRARGWRGAGAHRRRRVRTGEPIDSARAPVGCPATGPAWVPAPLLIQS